MISINFQFYVDPKYRFGVNLARIRSVVKMLELATDIQTYGTDIF